MSHKIEIVGMRKDRDLKIVKTIIILAILGIIASLSIIFYNKHKVVEASTENSNVITEQVAMSDNSASAEEGKANAENTNSEDKSSESNNDTDENASTNVENNNQPATEEEKEFINSVKNIYNGEEKRVFLTFDDGPTKEVTPYILDVLDKYNVKATFFVLGTRVKQNPDILKRTYEAGHYIANHGYSHKYSSVYKSADTVLDEYNRTENAIREALGNDSYSSNLFRFPGGSKGGPYEEIKKEARSKLNEYGIAYLDWNALTYDAEGAKSKDDILKNLKETTKGWDNVVLLMHDSADKKVTYETLEEVIKYLQDEGYAFKNIYDIIASI